MYAIDIEQQGNRYGGRVLVVDGAQQFVVEHLPALACPLAAAAAVYARVRELIHDLRPREETMAPTEIEKVERTVEELRRELQMVTVELKQYTALAKQQAANTADIIKRLNTLFDRNEDRLRSLEQWRASMPGRWLDAEQVASDFRALRSDVNNLYDWRESINAKLAKWAGIAGAAMVVGNLLVQLAIKGLTLLF